MVDRYRIQPEGFAAHMRPAKPVVMVFAEEHDMCVAALKAENETLRAELEQVKREYDLLRVAQDGEYADTWKVRAEEAAERLARVVTDAMANAMLEFVHSKKASTLTNTEMFRQGIELALAEPAGELHGPYAWLSGNRTMSEDSWILGNDPMENDKEYFSIPLYAKVDPFMEKVAAPDGEVPCADY